MSFRGHALYWYQMLPQRLLAAGDPRDIERMLVDHVRRTVGRFAGRVNSWDVANEVIWLPDGRADGMRTDAVFLALGEEFLDLVFHTAREEDPAAELVLNEALLSHVEQQRRRELFLELLQRLLARGVPVDAIGIQSHLFWHDHQPLGALDPEGVRQLIREAAKLGVHSHLTELDVFDREFPTNERERDALVAASYLQYLKPVLAEPGVRGVYFWGLRHNHSWCNTYMARVMPETRRPDGKPMRPLLFDEQGNVNGSFEAVRASILARVGAA
jgi:endo-1,4-beta-xylanase